MQICLDKGGGKGILGIGEGEIFMFTKGTCDKFGNFIKYLLPLFLFVFSLFGADHKVPQVQFYQYQASVTKIEFLVKEHCWKFEGKLDGKKFAFKVFPDTAQMLQGGKIRYFDPREAQLIHVWIDSLVVYAVESEVWWVQGKGSLTPAVPLVVPKEILDEIARK